MNKAVYKIDLSKALTHELPMGAVPLYTDYQEGNICVWLLVEPERRKLNTSFLVAGTGWTLPAFIRDRDYIGSCRNPDNRNCWHVFELGYTDQLKPFDKSTLETMALGIDGEGDASSD